MVEGVKLTVAERRTVLSAPRYREVEAEVRRAARGSLGPDRELRDTEWVPLSNAVDAYSAREVQLHVSDT